MGSLLACGIKRLKGSLLVYLVELKGKWNVEVEREDCWKTLNVIKESEVEESIIPISKSFKHFL